MYNQFSSPTLLYVYHHIYTTLHVYNYIYTTLVYIYIYIYDSRVQVAGARRQKAKTKAAHRHWAMEGGVIKKRGDRVALH